MSDCSHIVYGSVNGAVVIFYKHIKKGNAVEASYVKVMLGCVLLALSEFFFICLCHVPMS